LYCLGETDVHEDDAAAALPRLEQATALFRRLGTPLGLAWCQLLRGTILVQRRDGAAARPALEESATMFGALGEERGRALALSGQSALADTQGDFATAEAVCREALSAMWTLGGRPDIPVMLEACAAVAAALAQPARAARLAGAAVALRRAVGVGWVQRFGIKLEDRLDAARQMLGEAAFAAAWDEGRALSMDEAVAQALAPDEPVSATTDERAIATTEPTPVSRATGPLSAPASAPAPAAWAPLTAREREVAAAVAQGLTNGEIAERLVITRNTAGVHVVHILNKLGLHSRSQIAAWAATHGLVEES
jgi:non-specific serine/threonine protein kinase